MVVIATVCVILGVLVLGVEWEERPVSVLRLDDPEALYVVTSECVNRLAMVLVLHDNTAWCVSCHMAQCDHAVLAQRRYDAWLKDMDESDANFARAARKEPRVEKQDPAMGAQ